MSTLGCTKLAACPGCPLGNDDYDAGVATKHAEVTSALGAYPDLTPLVLPARGATPVVAYRLRAKLVCEGQRLGLYARGSHRVVDVSGCLVLSPSLTATSEALRRLLPLPMYGADLRETSEGVLVTLLSDEARTRTVLEKAARALVEDGAALSVAVSLRPAGNLRVVAGEPEVVAGPETARHQLSEDAPHAYAAHGGFVQAHAGQASYVQRAITEGLAQRLGTLETAQVLELFAGNGSLALRLARAGASVTAVEAYAPAIALSKRAALDQRLELTAVARDATRFLTDAPNRSDAIVVNPPRRGLEPALRRAIGLARPRALAYVSCNPETLARDLSHLRLLGLSAESVEPLDMIPWSDAVEALVWLTPAPPPAERVLFEDEHWLAFDQRPWSTGSSGVAFRAKTAAGVSALARALEGAERELLLLCRGNLRKQGTVTRHRDGQARPGARYRKQDSVGRHSLVSALCSDADELGALQDFASIGRPVLGDARFGDARSNQYVEHRHGLDRSFVHVARVQLSDLQGRPLEVTSPLAPDLGRALESLASD